MDINKIHLMIQQGLQKNGVFAYQDVGHDEIDLHLESEMLLMIDDVIRDQDKPFDGYDKNTINLSILKNIYTHRATLATLTAITTPTGSKLANQPANMYLPIRVWTDVKYKCDGADTTRKSRCRLVDADKADDLVSHVIFKPTIDSPIAFLTSDKVYVLTDGTFSIEAIYLDYLQEFTPPLFAVDVDGNYAPGSSTQCIFHKNVHMKLVDRTIARIKSFNEGNPQVIQRLDRNNITN